MQMLWSKGLTTGAIINREGEKVLKYKESNETQGKGEEEDLIISATACLAQEAI